MQLFGMILSRSYQWRNNQTSLALIVGSGGVGGFLFYPAVQLRKFRPTPSFTPRQTLMPEFDQSPFYIRKSRRHKGPVSYITGLWCWRLRRILSRGVTVFLRSEGRSGNWSRSCGFHLQVRNFLWRSFSERVINAAP